MTNANRIWEILFFPILGVPESAPSQYQKAWSTFATGQPIFRDAIIYPEQEAGRLASLQDLLAKDHSQYAPNQLTMFPPSRPDLTPPEVTAITRTDTRIHLDVSPIPPADNLAPAGRAAYAHRQRNLYSDEYEDKNFWTSAFFLSSTRTTISLDVPSDAATATVSVWSTNIYTLQNRFFLYAPQAYTLVSP